MGGVQSGSPMWLGWNPEASRGFTCAGTWVGAEGAGIRR